MPLPLPLALLQVILAVLELRDADGDGLGALAGQLLDLLQFLAQLPGVLDLGQDLLGDLLVAIEELQQFLAHALTSSVRISVLPSLFLVCDSNTGSFSRIATAPTMLSRTSSPSNLLVGVFVDRLEQAFAEGAQVRAAVAGVLAVDEGIKRLAVAAVAVGEAELQRLARRNAAADRSARCRPLAGLPSPGPSGRCATGTSWPLIDQPQAGVQVAVMPQPPLDVLGAELDFLENLRVRLETR